MVLGNGRLTIRDFVDLVGVLFGSVRTILKDHLGLRRVKSHLVPKFLNFFEKERRVQSCETMLSDYQGSYKQIITSDESWIYVYDPETTDQSSEYRLKGEDKPKRFPTGQTVNKEYYLSVMRHLREAIFKNRPELWANNS